MDGDPPPTAGHVLEITAIERADTQRQDPLFRFGVDRPVAPSRHNAFDFLVAGWVLHPERRIVSVQVTAGGEAIGWGHVQLPRPDVEKVFPNVPGVHTCGFHLAASAVGLPPAFDCAVEANVDDGRRVELARIRGTRTLAPDDGEAGLQPLIVTSLARSGSTLLLGLLAGHPEIVVDRIVPYETRTSSYWMHVYKVLSRPANHARAGDLDTFVYNGHFVGQNPYNAAFRNEPQLVREWYGRTSVDGLAAFCRQTIQSFYHVIAKVNGQARPRYFAEKTLGSPTTFLWRELYTNAHEIFLVRDFRDMAASILAFNAKRGYPAFARQQFTSDEEYMHHLQMSARELRLAWQQRAQSSLLVRYEDLVRCPQESLARILQHLGLDVSPKIIQGMLDSVAATPELQGHRTSQDAESSIGRWRVDMEPRLQQVCQASLAEALAEFGYTEPVA
ncbi:MAG: sulfotransferase [Chloroflexi bacterium]|nr:MAG: sulfotransferase [Chloroflexota bacterium]